VITDTPNNAINPTPADMLKGIPRIHKARTPPMTDKGTVVKITKAYVILLKAINSSSRIRNNATGTTNIKVLIAFCRFSNCPPYSK
jgi:hypothetical protein